jgi:hypothetical protein
MSVYSLQLGRSTERGREREVIGTKLTVLIFVKESALVVMPSDVCILTRTWSEHRTSVLICISVYSQSEIDAYLQLPSAPRGFDTISRVTDSKKQILFLVFRAACILFLVFVFKTRDISHELSLKH